MFWALCKSIFGNFIIGNESRFSFNVTVTGDNFEWSPDIHLNDNQFKNYLRRTDWERFLDNELTGLNVLMDQLERRVNDKIASLTGFATLNYTGAVEIQANIPSGVQDKYANFSFSEGLIWCAAQGQIYSDGQDQVTIESPCTHKHVNTKAETTTASFATLRGGSSLVGNFAVGNKVMVGSNNNFGIGKGVSLPMMEVSGQESLTYPLYGENVLGWRATKKSHNNVPPSCNLYIRYLGPEVQTYSMPSMRRLQHVGPDVTSRSTMIEAQYESKTINQLPDYLAQDLTPHDYLLRISMDGSQQMRLMKQSVQTLLDIFAAHADRRLSLTLPDSGTLVPMAQVLKKKLDQELVLKGEVSSWYFLALDRLERINAKIQRVRDMLKSIGPLTYVGRVVMSTTDDVESKVIAHYGGKHWRRMVNFLRGVGRNGDGTATAELGKKFGEEYVCLRESNMPLHTHAVAHSGQIEDPHSPAGPENKQAFWLRKDMGGDQTGLVNTQPDSMDSTLVGKDTVGKQQVGFQTSPLEYEKTGITVPHDNMPPYREVYIWQCVEVTDEERDALGMYPIHYHMGDCEGIPVDGMLGPGTATFYDQTALPYEPPPAEAKGYDFREWSPTHIPSGHSGKFDFFASWTAWDCLVKFKFLNGNETEGTFKYGTAIEFPPEDQLSGRDGYKFNGWWTNAGRQRQSGDVVDEKELTLYEHIEPISYAITYDMGTGPADVPSGAWTSYTVESPTYEPPEPDCLDDDAAFQGWELDGSPLPIITHGSTGDKTFHAKWNYADVTVQFMNGQTRVAYLRVPNKSNLMDCENIVIPSPQKRGYRLDGWWTSLDEDGEQLPENLNYAVNGSVTFYAKWVPVEYAIEYVMNEHG